MSTFVRVMLVTIAALIMQTGASNAGQSAKLKTTEPQSQLHALTHVVLTEGHYHNGQMNGIAQVVANRAFFYGDANNLKPVVYNKEMRGPINKKTPWKGKEAERFQRTKAYLATVLPKLMSGKLVASKYATAWHFDMRSHTDWGRFLGKECAVVQGRNECVWFYEARNKRVTGKLAARYKGQVVTASN